MLAVNLNLYTYCANNPIRYVDPSGHFFKEIQEKFNSLIKNQEETSISINSAWDAKRFEEVKVTTAPLSQAKIPAIGTASQESSTTDTTIITLTDQRFNSRDDAAYAFAMAYNGQSIMKNAEYGANIYSQTSGLFWWSKTEYYIKQTVTQGISDATYIPEPNIEYGTYVGTVHTHGAYEESYIEDGINYKDIFSPADKSLANNSDPITPQPIYLVNPKGELLRFDPYTKRYQNNQDYPDKITVLDQYTNIPYDPNHPDR